MNLKIFKKKTKSDSFQVSEDSAFSDFEEKLKKEVQESQEKLAKQVAHDLKSPLGSIETVLTCFREMDIKDPNFETFLNLLKLSAERIDEIASGMVKKYRTENNLDKSEPSAVKQMSIRMTNHNLLVIDDDPSMREQWRIIAEQQDCSAHLISSYEKLVTNEGAVKSCQTAIVDYHYDNSEYTGEDVVKFLKSVGFESIYLCTSDYWKKNIQELANNLDVILCPKPLPQIILEVTIGDEKAETTETKENATGGLIS